MAEGTGPPSALQTPPSPLQTPPNPPSPAHLDLAVVDEDLQHGHLLPTGVQRGEVVQGGVNRAIGPVLELPGEVPGVLVRDLPPDDVLEDLPEGGLLPTDLPPPCPPPTPSWVHPPTLSLHPNGLRVLPGAAGVMQALWQPCRMLQLLHFW